MSLVREFMFVPHWVRRRAWGQMYPAMRGYAVGMPWAIS